jgi:hypothetical protein
VAGRDRVAAGDREVPLPARLGDTVSRDLQLHRRGGGSGLRVSR